MVEMKHSMGAGADPAGRERVTVLEAGALDGLALEDVKKLTPEPGDYVLVTRMRDGTAVRIGEKHILPLMQERIDAVVRQGADVVALLCTGEFPPFRCEKLLVVPQKVMLHVAAAVVAGRGAHREPVNGADFRLGIIAPDAGQIPQATRRWGALTSSLRVEPASPYGEQEVVNEAARRLGEWGADVIVMDCIGYTLKMKEIAKETTGVPIILARSILGRVLAELV